MARITRIYPATDCTEGTDLSVAIVGQDFDDLLSTTFPDADHSTSERRFLIIGASVHGRVLVVAYTEQEETVRIISARPATRRERIFYEEDSRHSR